LELLLTNRVTTSKTWTRPLGLITLNTTPDCERQAIK
jgi:hypothetical protein